MNALTNQVQSQPCSSGRKRPRIVDLAGELLHLVEKRWNRPFSSPLKSAMEDLYKTVDCMCPVHANIKLRLIDKRKSYEIYLNFRPIILN